MYGIADFAVLLQLKCLDANVGMFDSLFCFFQPQRSRREGTSTVTISPCVPISLCASYTDLVVERKQTE